jgi:RNA polymerase sigma-70 factor (ECF subfamily)
MQNSTLRLGAPNSDLIQRAQKGDTESISWLFEHFQPGIFRYLYYRIGDRQTAEDLTSEVFVRMLRSLPGFQIQTGFFQSWLFRIARNLAVDFFRQSGFSEELTEDFPDSQTLPEAALEQSLTHTELLKALATLKSEQSDVIILRFVLGQPIAQVAQVLGKSEDAIKGLQRRSLLALREALSNESAVTK